MRSHCSGRDSPTLSFESRLFLVSAITWVNNNQEEMYSMQEVDISWIMWERVNDKPPPIITRTIFEKRSEVSQGWAKGGPMREVADWANKNERRFVCIKQFRWSKRGPESWRADPIMSSYSEIKSIIVIRGIQQRCIILYCYSISLRIRTRISALLLFLLRLQGCFLFLSTLLELK